MKLCLFVPLHYTLSGPLAGFLETHLPWDSGTNQVAGPIAGQLLFIIDRTLHFRFTLQKALEFCDGSTTGRRRRPSSKSEAQLLGKRPSRPID
jgi:hypothetical protein